jgi:glycine/D-amino acid oxidase-like deaminating enzyme
MPSIEQACYWLAQREPRPAVRLEGAHEADVAIVGAGLTGLWTALFIKELDASLSIVVVEQGIAAYGGSGRNAGILAEPIDHGHAAAIAHFGEAEARALARIGEANIADMLAFFTARGIECHYEPTGRLMVALTPGQVSATRETVEAARRVGATTYRLLDRDEVRANLNSPLYLGGVEVTAGGILDPVRLVDGLRREAERVGVLVYERSPVTRVAQLGAGVRVLTAAGHVTAQRAVLATSAYTHHLLPGVLHRFIPLYDYVLVSEPLTPVQREAIGWRRRQSVTDYRTFFNYYRLTRDDRILWGTSEAVYYRGNQVDPSCDHSPGQYAALRASFRRHFPALADLEFPWSWGGAICSTTRLTPFFGRALGGRVLYGLGYTGHGLGTTRLAGRILAHMTLDRPSELLSLSLVRKRPIPFPPEPLRSWAVDRVTRSIRKVDQGEEPDVLLKLLDRMGIGFSS